MKQFGDILKSHADQLKDLNPSSREGRVHWKSPSNIALVKYWGKLPGQVPANASLSLTLSESLTRTRIDYSYDPGQVRNELKFEFEGRQQATFYKKLITYLESIHVYLPWLQHTNLTIASENTFPHSSGIASSASSMSALALGLCDIEKQIFGAGSEINHDRMASFLARLGSGSASRSVYGNMSIWGKTKAWEESSDEYALPFSEFHDSFKIIHDSILIIESGQKEVSSSAGHMLMNSNPYAEQRIKAAQENMQGLISVLRQGDWSDFIDIMENEALSLHAMMMTSKPGFILMKENTIAAIRKLQEFRKESGCAVGFTLDAGANVHVIYRDEDFQTVRSFIQDHLLYLCENSAVIHDKMGKGPARI